MKGGTHMAINGINGYSSGYYNYNNSISQLKLQQALNKNTTSGTNFYDKKYTNLAKSSYAESQNFIKKYNSAMSDLLQSSNSLKSSNASSVLNDKTAVSSDAEVLTANKKYSWDKSQDTYNVNVQQLATAQTNTSNQVKSSDLAVSDANFSINTGNGTINVGVSAQTVDGEQKTNKQLFSDIAKQINSNKEAGVTASVVEKDGKSSLQITGAKTGESNSFTVQGDLSSAAGMDTVSKTAQNAIYTVKQNNGVEKQLTSESNNVSVGNGKIDVSLKQTGSADIAMGVDNNKVVSAVEDLVKKYNSSLKVLNDNVERGTGVERQLGNMLHGPASEEKLNMVGISTKKDGTLELDKAKLTESLQKDQKMATDIIGGSFGIAQGMFSDARSGLTTPSNSLINNDMQKTQENVRNDPFQFTAMFSRRGSFNMMNYNTVGMMFNMLI